jgi:hypothetical protein
VNRRMSRGLSVLSTVAASFCLLFVAAAPAANAAQGSAPANSYTSIFAEESPEFVGAGWDLCAAPITWSVDVSALKPKAATARITDLEWALEAWGHAAGITFQYTGQEELDLDEEVVELRSKIQNDRTRHVSFSFVTRNSTDLLSKTVVGLGSPMAQSVSSQGATTASIIGGSAIFSVDFLAGASKKQARALMLHEIGHVLGLGHTDDDSQVMHPILDGETTLGVGDLAGIRSITRVCAS